MLNTESQENKLLLLYNVITQKGERYMDWLTGIQNAINYIEENLTEKIDYDEAAKQASCSSFYFQ